VHAFFKGAELFLSVGISKLFCGAAGSDLPRLQKREVLLRAVLG
jgi:hypothetical protein